MWRYTHDPKYREWGKQMIDALEKYARTDKGYHGVTFDLKGNDRMESFFLAETLKYLYLLYSNDSILPCIVLLT